MLCFIYVIYLYLYIYYIGIYIFCCGVIGVLSRAALCLSCETSSRTFDSIIIDGGGTDSTRLLDSTTWLGVRAYDFDRTGIIFNAESRCVCVCVQHKAPCSRIYEMYDSASNTFARRRRRRFLKYTSRDSIARRKQRTRPNWKETSNHQVSYAAPHSLAMGVCVREWVWCVHVCDWMCGLWMCAGVDWMKHIRREVYASCTQAVPSRQPTSCRALCALDESSRVKYYLSMYFASYTYGSTPSVAQF